MQGIGEQRDLETVRALAAKVDIPPFQEQSVKIVIEDAEDQQGGSSSSSNQQHQQHPGALQSEVEQTADEEAQKLQELKEKLLSIGLLPLLLLFCVSFGDSK